ncbi:hypothetical protein GGF50DRAFT_88217 [Schizophyllum commune]
MPLDSLISPNDHAAHVSIIGGGIIGLSTAWTLRNSGYKVTVLAEEYATLDVSKPRLTSQIAGALYSVKMCETVFFFDKHALGTIQKLVVAKGATHVMGKVEQELRNKYDAKVIVNPTDLRKKILANDESVYPLRGAVLRTPTTAIDAKRSKRRWSLRLSSSFAQLLTLVRKFVFIVSRTNGILYVGGFSESNETSFFLEDHPNVLKMARDAETFCCPDLDMERRDSASFLAQ